MIQEHAGDVQALRVLFQSLLLMCKIYYSLNSQDMPEFFEDHQKQFMPLLLKYLAYDNALLQAVCTV